MKVEEIQELFRSFESFCNEYECIPIKEQNYE